MPIVNLDRAANDVDLLAFFIGNRGGPAADHALGWNTGGIFEIAANEILFAAGDHPNLKSVFLQQGGQFEHGGVIETRKKHIVAGMNVSLHKSTGRVTVGGDLHATKSGIHFLV